MIILAVDYGDARTGLAVCDKSELLASPVTVISEYNRERLIVKILEQATALRAEEIVVGNPLNMNGSAGPRSELAQQLAEILRTQSDLPVTLWDERSTTVSAIGILNQTDVRGKKRKAVIDAVAAVLILESYLAYRKNHTK
ncbi:MAG TPA: Holliday junction resolvase RuvX [Clostridia bacterium]|nr:Holliday junction resolvase RuvX [Clostridia bacterium]